MSKSKYIPGYQHIKFLGQGVFGNVDLYYDKENNKKVVIKSISYLNDGKKVYDAALSEINIVSRLQHPRIIQFLNYFIIRDRCKVYILMDYAQNGTLGNFINLRKNNGCYLNQNHALSFLFDILCGIKYLHSQQILHCDIKPENILIWNDWRLKIADFGIAKFCNQTTTRGQGTPLYMAPELFYMATHDHCSDVWSIGIIFYEICMLRHPFLPIKDYNEFVIKASSGFYFPINCKALGYSEEMQIIIANMIQPVRENRKTIDLILTHPLFQNNVV